MKSCASSPCVRAGVYHRLLMGPVCTRRPAQRCQAIICPRTSQFNGGTSHPKLKTWDSRPTQPETSRTAAGTGWASLPSSYGIYCFTSAFELWDLSLQQDLQTKMLHIIVMDLDMRAKEKFGCASHTMHTADEMFMGVWACNSSRMARRAT